MCARARACVCVCVCVCVCSRVCVVTIAGLCDKSQARLIIPSFDSASFCFRLFV